MLFGLGAAMKGKDGRDVRLTERQWHCVQLMVDGLSDGEIAEVLFISPHTVRSHLMGAEHMLGLKSRVQLTRWYLERLSRK